MPPHFIILTFSTPLVNIKKKKSKEFYTSIDFLTWTMSQSTASQECFVTNTSEVLSLKLLRKNPVSFSLSTDILVYLDTYPGVT